MKNTKNIIAKILVGCAVVSVGGFLYWYYDFGGGLGAGAGQNSDVAIIDSVGSSSVYGSTADGADGLVGGSGFVDKSNNPSGAGESAVPVSGQDNPSQAIANSDGGDISNSADGDSPIVASGDSTAASSAGTAAATTATGSSKNIAPPQICSFANAASMIPSRKIILNEIAWMGSLQEASETPAKASNREWIELKNISATAIDISGWQILDVGGGLKIVVGGAAAGTGGTSTEIPADGFYLLVRDGQSVEAGAGSMMVTTDAGYSGALTNGGDQLALFDADCGVSDFLDASAGWPSGNNATKQTLERDVDGVGWHTSVAPGGTPRAENSLPAPMPASSSAAATTSPVVVSSSTQSQQYIVSISFTGNGSGAVSSSPAGILCGFTCKVNYAAGTKLTLTESPVPGSAFNGWSGGSGTCGGSTGSVVPVQCSFIVSSSIALVADFEEVPTASMVPIDEASQSESSSGSNSSSTVSTASAGHLLIAAIQIASASSSNDFVKIFNPTGELVNLSGWKLHKKSNTGTDYSLKTFATGAAIAPGGYFVWANSGGSFADSIGADASSTEKLSADNSVALFDAMGAIVDQVAWGTGVNQYVEGAAYPTDPTANQVLTRQTSGGGAGTSSGAMVDTDNNAADFAIE